MPNLASAITTVPDPERHAMACCIRDMRPFWHAQIFVDENREGIGENARKAWEFCASVMDSDWSLVVQDDAVFCGDFEYGLLKIMETAPGRMISFMEWSRMSDQANEWGVHWVQTRGNAMGVAIMMPTAMVRHMLTWIDKHYRHDKWLFNGDDAMIAAYCMAHDERPLHFVPTLVQHGLPSESTLGHSNKNRVCRYSLAPDRSAKEIEDWSRGLDSPIKSSATLAPWSWIEQNFDVRRDDARPRAWNGVHRG